MFLSVMKNPKAYRNVLSIIMLVSMLQYMKETRIDNPEIIVKDSQILELDEIVTEEIADLLEEPIEVIQSILEELKK